MLSEKCLGVPSANSPHGAGVLNTHVNIFNIITNYLETQLTLPPATPYPAQAGNLDRNKYQVENHTKVIIFLPLIKYVFYDTIRNESNGIGFRAVISLDSAVRKHR